MACRVNYAHATTYSRYRRNRTDSREDPTAEVPARQYPLGLQYLGCTFQRAGGVYPSNALDQLPVPIPKFRKF